MNSIAHNNVGKTTEMHQEESGELSLMEILGLIFSKIWVGIVVFLSVVLVVAIFSFAYPKTYKVSGKLLVKPKLEKPFIFTDGSNRVSQINARVSQEMINTAVNLITANDVLKYTLAETTDIDMNNEAEVTRHVNQMRGAISANPISLSNLINVELSGSDPEKVVSDLNQLLDSFVRFNIQAQGFGSNGVTFFENQTQGFKNMFDSLTSQLIEKRLDGNLISPSQQQENYLALVRDLERQKSDLLTRLAEINGRITYSTTALSNIDSSAEYIGLPTELLQSYPSLIEMEKTLAQLIINKQRATNDFKPTTKQVRDANAQYNNMRTQIGLFIGNAIHDLEQQALVEKTNIDAVNKRINEVQADSSVVAANEAKLELIEIEHNLVKENYKLYGRKLEEARINQEKDKELFSNISVVNRPSVPTSPWFPNASMLIPLSIPLGLILGLLAILVSINFERSLSRRKRITSSFAKSSSPVIASFETLPQN